MKGKACLPELSDPGKEYERVSEFLTKQCTQIGLSAVVVGLSGGIDSVTVAALCEEALDDTDLLCVFMPESATPGRDYRDVRTVSEEFGLNVRELDISRIMDCFLESMPDLSQMGRANLKARIRMAILYAFANKLSGVVVGTSNLSEWLLGYFTKYGDGVSDIAPVAHLYKTELRQIAKWVGVPDPIIEKPPSAGLWPGQTDENELGADYYTLDRVLLCLHDLGWSADRTAERLEMDHEFVSKIARLMANTAHKRKLPSRLDREHLREE